MSEIITATYPDEFASNQEKERKSYGKKIGQVLDSTWFTGGALSLRRAWIDEMRSFSRGEQCVKQYIKTIEGERKEKKSKLDFKTHKIDYTQLKVLATLKNVVVNAIDESLFKPRADAIDRTAINRKKDYLEKIDKDFYLKGFRDTIGRAVGMDINPKEIPKTEKDLEIKKLEFKPLIELAQELAIENVMKLENFEAIKDKVDEDLFDLGVGVVRHYTDFTEGIKIKYVDPYNWVHNDFQMDDGRDIRLNGVVAKDTIANLAKQAGGLEPAELKAIKNHAIGKSDNVDPYNEEVDGDRLVEYVTFAYEVSKEREYKRKKRNGRAVKLIDRTKDEKPYRPQRDSSKMSIPFSVWYEGVYIPKADVMIKWEEIRNQAEGGVNRPISPFIVYAPKVKKLSEKGDIRFDSLVQRAIPIVNDIHRDWYKLQQLKMELRPNTVKISPKLLDNVMLNGVRIDPSDVLDLYFGRGLYLADEVDEDGEKIGTAIQEQNGGVNNNALSLLANELVNNYDRLRQLLGINELRDGSTKPNSKTSVTVQKLLYASSNNATNHIVKGSFQISLECASAISSRLYDVFTTPALKNRYLDVIGTDNVLLLDEIKRYPMTKFAIFFDFKPDNADRLAFEQSLIDSRNAREITVAQYNTARHIRNTKSAIKYLEHAVDENIMKAEQLKQNNLKLQAEANAQTSVITEKTKQETVTVKFEVDKQMMLLESEIKSNQKKEDAMLDELKAQQQHIRNMELKGLEVVAKQNIEGEKEDRKDDREYQRGTIQSKLIDQRKTGKEPIDFNKKVLDIFSNNQLPTAIEN